MIKKMLSGALLGWLLLAASCEDYKECNSPVETALGMGFYRLDPVRDTKADSTLPALTCFGLGRADSLLADELAANRVFVPLKATEGSTAFYLQPDSTMQDGDTVTLLYRHELHFISAGCGFTTYYTLDSAYSTRHYIDSVSLVRRNINTTNAINVELYY